MEGMDNESIMRSMVGVDKYKDATIENAIYTECKMFDKPPVPFNATLCHDAPRLPYRAQKMNVRPQQHIGQLKLSLTEIMFLITHRELSDTVLYAGAAPCTHLPAIIDMFPEKKFILWDPSPFNVKNSDRVEVHQEYFTAEVAKQYAGRNLLFMSDIRSGTNSMTNEEFEERVRIDMEWQMDWHKIIQPAMAMYKFRLPYNPGVTKWMMGTLYLQPYAPKSTTELRCVVPQDWKMAKYNNKKIEEQMYYFNHYTRNYWYSTQPFREMRLCGCWDCAAFVSIIRTYVGASNSTKERDERIMWYVRKVLESVCTVNRLRERPHGDAHLGPWFARDWSKYEGMKAHVKYGTDVTVGIWREYKKVMAAIKKEHPDLRMPPIYGSPIVAKGAYHLSKPPS
jgi:hypothetical protein